MKTISTYFKAFLSLAPLGFVMFFLAIAILFALISQSSDAFDAALERMDLLNTLESKVTFNLIETQLQEAHQMFVFDYGLPDDNSARKAQDANTVLNQELASLEKDGRFNSDLAYTTDITSELQNFNNTRAAHQKIFSKAASEYKAGNEDEAISVLEQQYEENQQTLDSQLRNLIVSVEHDRLAALKDFPDNANTNVQAATIGFVMCLILALLGYQVIASIVRPLRYLHTVITAIGGDRYNPEMQKDLLKKGDPAGSLARALDELARGEQTRNEGIKQEIERLRQELYESRRRRLKISHTTETAE